MAISLGGCCIVDSSVRVEQITNRRVRRWVERKRPEPGHLNVVESLPGYVQKWFDPRTEGLTVGGGAANAAWRLADLGVKTEIWGVVGIDPWGNFFRQTLEGRGIDTSRVKVYEGLPTSRTIVVEEKDDRGFIHVTGANGIVRPDHYQSSDDTWGDYVGYFFILGSKWPGLSSEYMGEIVARMRERGKTAMVATTADPRRKWDGVDLALENANIFFCNALEAAGITGEETDDYAAMAGNLHERGVRLVSITRGADGAYLSRSVRDGIVTANVPGIHVVPTERRAAGDSFAAGSMIPLERDEHHDFVRVDLDELGRYGNAMGALAVEGYKHINPNMLRRYLDKIGPVVSGPHR